eukprot:14771651-Heterocapsa_arctica.AAC.1
MAVATCVSVTLYATPISPEARDVQLLLNTNDMRGGQTWNNMILLIITMNLVLGIGDFLVNSREVRTQACQNIVKTVVDSENM